jgi:cytoskeletal protein RodZ
MSNLSDKEIDRLSREAADSYEPDATSLNWSRLEQKLVEQMPERPPDGFHFGRVSPFVWGPAVILVAGISFYIIKANIYSKLSTRTPEPVSQISKSHTSDSGSSAGNGSFADSVSSAQNSLSTTKGNSTTSEQSTVAKSHSRSDIDKSESGSSILKAGHADTQTSNPISAANNTNLRNSSDKDKVSKVDVSSVKMAVGAGVAQGMAPRSKGSTKSNTASNAADESIPDGSSSHDPGSGVQSVSLSNSENVHSIHNARGYELPGVVAVGSDPGTVKGNDVLLNKPVVPGVPVTQKSVHINRSLNIGFTFGADYTDAGGITNNQLSNNIGITLGYYLTNKISVNTGVIYSNKFYWAKGHGQNRPNYSAYTNTTNAWAPDIEYINGSCNMYEIPLTIRYDFAKNDKTLFFINAGASSYFLLKQTNIYFTHSGGGRPVAWLSKDESQTNYWFGVGDISFGLETDLGKGFSFQAEPFFRIPFQNMGVENLKMYSYGFMLSFRYTPVLSRTRK